MQHNAITCHLNKIKGEIDLSLFHFSTLEKGKKVSNFHQSLPNYQPTPLIRLSTLANHLGINKLLIKDESQRFDLNAFKVLGASYAIAKYLAEKCGIADNELTFPKILAKQEDYKDLILVTATDGNHGRAVAWAAQLFGCKSVVYLPKGSSIARLDSVKSYGAQAEILDVNYDDTVIHAKHMADKNGWELIQDTAWQGYEKIPMHIMQGYFSLVTEYLNQEPDIWPTHVFVQAGVGSLAAAIFAYFYRCTHLPTPQLIVVEPDGAPCIYESMKQGGQPFTVEGDLPTIMAGLACGEPSSLGLKIINAVSSASLVCTDDIARRGMKVLGNPLAGDQPIISGESGAVTLGAVFELLSNEKYSTIKNELNLSADSKVLLFSTEGDTDAEIYRDIVWG